ncbi:MAG: heavy metal translocating P-type ATPase [Candidatus Zixiibacteriota bacterium]
MEKETFKIRGMDCAEEVAILKRELAPLVGGKERLSFDILNGKLTIERSQDDQQGWDSETIRKAVAATGMQAIPWKEYCSTVTCPVEESLWERRGRTLMVTASGVSLTLGYIFQAIRERSLLGPLAGETEIGLISILLYSLTSVTGGWFIVPKAFFALRKLRPDMNLLMTIAAIGAIGIGEWFEAATVTFLFALALLLESWSVGRARRAIGALMDLSPTKARIMTSGNGRIEEVSVQEVPVGAVAVVRPGEKVPLDGIIVSGSSHINQSAITGESIPVGKVVGDEVFAGTINEDGAFEFKVTKRAEDTTLARIIHMVEEAQSRRAPSEQWVQKFARYYTPAMMGVALFIALVIPLFAGDWGKWFYEALVVLVIACPCALVISTPVSIVAGLTSAARAGVLIKGGVHLEAPAQLQAIAFDKTGTLTDGKPEVQQVVPLSGHTGEELLSRAAALEAMSEHPLAKAIMRRAENEQVSINGVANFRSVRGKGAEGDIQGRPFWIGSHRLMHERGGETPEFHQKAEELEDAGHSVVAVGNENHVCGLISISDSMRTDLKKVIDSLKASGIKRTIMLTGDNEGTARAVAEAVGIDEFRAELLPEDKVAAVEELVEKYERVAMVGDGINDAPAMARATVAIAMGAAGSDAAIETADIALMSDDLSRIPWLIKHSRRVLRTIKSNIWFALGTKAVFLALALLGLATLWMAIAADMGASLLVIANSLRLLDGKT